MSAGDAGSADPTYVVAAELAEPVIALVLGVDQLVVAFDSDDEDAGLAAIAQLVAARNRVVELMTWQPGIPPGPIELGSWGREQMGRLDAAYAGALERLDPDERRRLVEGEWDAGEPAARLDAALGRALAGDPGVPLGRGPGWREAPAEPGVDVSDPDDHGMLGGGR